jgi:LysM repeat protein
MTSRFSALVSALLVLAAASTVFAGMLAMGIVSFSGPAPTASPIARPPDATPLPTQQPTIEPTEEPTPEPTAEPTQEPAEPTGQPQPTPGTYRVQPNDSLWLIGERFGVPWLEIAAANGIEGPDYRIRIDQVLIIPAPADPDATPDPDAECYLVQPNDNLTDIAYKLGVSTALLADVNGIDDWDDIEAGDCLTIPGRGPAASPTLEP